jgi:DNA mismatch repair protein MSH6
MSSIAFSSPIASTQERKSQRASKFKEKNESRYAWLLDIHDADNRPMDHPDYDPRTLAVPPSAWRDFTPFERQFWEIKAKHWDMVVFFKKGKFYGFIGD